MWVYFLSFFAFLARVAMEEGGDILRELFLWVILYRAPSESEYVCANNVVHSVHSYIHAQYV